MAKILRKFYENHKVNFENDVLCWIKNDITALSHSKC